MSLPPPPRLVALGLLLTALGFGIAAAGLEQWQYGMPGPGLTPLLACLCLLPLAVALLLEGLPEQERAPLQPVPLVVGLALVALVLAIEQIGLVLPVGLFTLAWARLAYRRPWPIALAAMLAVPAGLWLIFLKLLGIPLPAWPG